MKALICFSAFFISKKVVNWELNLKHISMELIETTAPKYAGFWLRFVANIIDQLLLQTVIVIFTLPLIFGMVTGIITASKEQGDASKAIAIISVIMGFVALLFAVSLIVGWLYYAIMESSKQQVRLGKWP